jgi:hypothetical protein
MTATSPDLIARLGADVARHAFAWLRDLPDLPRSGWRDVGLYHCAHCDRFLVAGVGAAEDVRQICYDGPIFRRKFPEMIGDPVRRG